MTALGIDGAIAQPAGALSAADAIAKFADDYNSRRFADVIADGEVLRKLNELDPQRRLVIGMAYYLNGDYAGCIKYVQENSDISSSSEGRQLLGRCLYGEGPQH